jgi:selenocysteine lyase/cysteine desulfurase
VLDNFDLYNRTVAKDPSATYSITDMRAAIAPGLGANPDEIVLTTNTTDGMCMSFNGLNWEAGDEIVSTNMEHPGGNGPMTHQAVRHGAVIKRVMLPVGADVEPDAYVPLFEALITSRTKAIMFSHIPYLSGMLLPAKRLCDLARAYGLVSIIDGAHVTGMMNVDFHAMGVDLYAGSGHKWQCGPRGTGIWYVRNQRQSNPLDVPMVWGVLVSGNGIGTRYNADGTLRNIGNFLQSHGHSNEPEWQALTDSCLFWEKIGRQKIEDYVTGLSKYLKSEVVRNWGRGSLMNSDHPELVSGITTLNPFRVKTDVAKVTQMVQRLNSDYGIVTVVRSFQNPAGGPNLTSVRVSTHLFHNRGDIDRLIHAVKKLTPQIDV